MGICESTNNEKAAATTTQPATTAQTAINQPAVEAKTESKGFLDNILGSNTNASNQNNNQSGGLLSGLMGSNTNQNNNQSGGILSGLMGSNTNTTNTNANTSTVEKVVNLAIENKDTLINMGKKIIN